MALFGTLNVAGPANRQGTLQTLAQNAAQAVLRRQRLKQVLSQAAATGGGGAQSGPNTPFQSSMHGRSMGVRGATMRPDLAPDVLAQMARAAGRPGHVPDGGYGGVFRRGGGGFDFGALPSPDPSAHPSDVGSSPFHPAPVAPGGLPQNINPGGPMQPAPTGAPVSSPIPTPGGSGAIQPAPAEGSPAGPGTSAPHQWIPLGSGLFYDPVNDIVRGPSNAGLSSIDQRF